jgi:hypothetical protein
MSKFLRFSWLLRIQKSENEYTHFIKHIYWENKQSQTSTVFTTLQNCQKIFFFLYLLYALSILWKESCLKCVAMLSGDLNTRWTLCEQERKLRLKYSETQKSREKTWVAKCLKCVHSFLRHSVYLFIWQQPYLREYDKLQKSTVSRQHKVM